MADSRVQKTVDLSNLVGTKLGNYRLERVIGRGRMGVVYLAQDEALLRPTAIKLLSWSAAEANGHDPVQWFLAEARLIARLNHPDVVQIYGAARQGDHCYIAMEYVPGLSAEAAVAQAGPLPPEKATQVVLKVASALHAAHRSGIVHRDVKPANLLMGGTGTVKLSDFGMALGVAGYWAGNARLRVGTPYYTAPEVWRGESALPASDIYSLGATYFHLLTGRPPYEGNSIAAIEQAHLRASVPDPRRFVPDLPASCALFIERAMAKAPRDRHASAEVLLWDARRVIQELVSKPEGAGPARPSSLLVPLPPEDRARTLLPAPALLAKALGFAWRPFFPAGPDEACRREPLALALRQLLARISDPAIGLITVAGGRGSGVASLCQATASALRRDRHVVSASVDEARGGSVFRLLCRRAGVADLDNEDARVNALIDLLSEERRRQPQPTVVFLDGWTPGHGSALGVAKLVAAALWTRAFKIVLAGEPGLLPGLARAGFDFPGGRAAEIAIPRLGAADVAGYVRGWINATLGRGAPPILFSPDASLLLSRRSEGAVERVDCIAENMLMLAAAEKSRVLTSWHAWAATDGERWCESRTVSDVPRRPERWPPREVVEAIDDCRRAAGLSPWPCSLAPTD